MEKKLNFMVAAQLQGFSCTTISRIYRELSEKEKISSEGSCVDENALFMSEFRGEWADWLEMIERQQ